MMLYSNFDFTYGAFHILCLHIFGDFWPPPPFVSNLLYNVSTFLEIKVWEYSVICYLRIFTLLSVLWHYFFRDLPLSGFTNILGFLQSFKVFFNFLSRTSIEMILRRMFGEKNKKMADAAGTWRCCLLRHSLWQCTLG